MEKNQSLSLADFRKLKDDNDTGPVFSSKNAGTATDERQLSLVCGYHPPSKRKRTRNKKGSKKGNRVIVGPKQKDLRKIIKFNSRGFSKKDPELIPIIKNSKAVNISYSKGDFYYLKEACNAIPNMYLKSKEEYRNLKNIIRFPKDSIVEILDTSKYNYGGDEVIIFRVLQGINRKGRKKLYLPLQYFATKRAFISATGLSPISDIKTPKGNQESNQLIKGILDTDYDDPMNYPWGEVPFLNRNMLN